MKRRFLGNYIKALWYWRRENCHLCWDIVTMRLVIVCSFVMTTLYMSPWRCWCRNHLYQHIEQTRSLGGLNKVTVPSYLLRCLNNSETSPEFSTTLYENFIESISSIDLCTWEIVKRPNAIWLYCNTVLIRTWSIIFQIFPDPHHQSVSLSN